MDSDLKENNWTGLTGSLGFCGLRPKGPSPQAKKIPIILSKLKKLKSNPFHFFSET
jgi:hypothetical protein